MRKKYIYRGYINDYTVRGRNVQLAELRGFTIVNPDYTNSVR